MTDTESTAPPGGRNRRGRAAEVLAKVEVIEVTIEKLVMGGEGLARFDGIPIFVPRAVPGDRLRVRLEQRRPDYGRAAIVEVLEAGARPAAAPLSVLRALRRLRSAADRRRAAAGAQGGGGRGDPATARPARDAATRTGGRRRLGLPPAGAAARRRWRRRPTRGRLLRPRQPSAGGGRSLSDSGARARAGSWRVWRPRYPTSRRAGWIWRRGRPAAGRWRRWWPGCRAAPWSWWSASTRSITTPGPSFRAIAGCCRGWSKPRSARGRATTPVTSTPASVCSPWPWRGATGGWWPSSRTPRRPATRASMRGATTSRRSRSWRCGPRRRLARLPNGCDRMVVDPPRIGLSREVRDGLLTLRPRRLDLRVVRPADAGSRPAPADRCLPRRELDPARLFPQTGHMEAVVQLVSATA